MPDCCVKNCDNCNCDITYFKFPVHNPKLLQKWLKQIGRLNWQPDENSYICAIHFSSSDIMDNPVEKSRVLKDDATPMLFLTQRNDVSPLKTRQSEKSAIDNCASGNSEIITIPSIIPTTPIILTPTIVEPLTGMNSTLIPLLSTPQRFRKILPKTDHNDSTIENSSPEKSDISSITPAQSYLIIIPPFDNSKSLPAPNNPPKLPSPNKKKPILRLTVNRKYDENPLLDKSKDNYDNDNDETKSDSTCGQSECDRSNAVEEVVINHKTLQKSVVFSLDLITGQISVCYRDISPVRGRNDKLPGTHMKLRENPPKKKMWDEPQELENMYKRVKQDCTSLRSRLQMLRKKHEKEKNEITKLQKELLSINRGQSGTSMIIKKSISKRSNNAMDIKLDNENEKEKWYNNKKRKKNNQEPNFNEKSQSTMNNNQHVSIFDDNNHVTHCIDRDQDTSISKVNEKNGENGHYNCIEIDEATVTVGTSDLKTLDSYDNIMDSTYINDQSV